MASVFVSPPPPAIRLAPWAVAAAAVVSAGLLLWAARDWRIAAAFAALVIAAGALMLLVRAEQRGEAAAGPADAALLHAALAASPTATAVTARDGALIAANEAWRRLAGRLSSPSELAGPPTAEIERAAWRDGAAGLPLDLLGKPLRLDARRAGGGEDHLVWTLLPAGDDDLMTEGGRVVAGGIGERLGLAGAMAALVDGEGRLLAGNRAFLARALGSGEAARQNFVELFAPDGDDRLRLARDGEAGTPVRLIQVPLGDDGGALFLALDETAEDPARGGATVHMHGLLELLPLGLALVERDGRLLFMNQAFSAAAGAPKGQPVVYPSDLVVKEDKHAVSDAIRRFAAGRGHTGDLSVRLAGRPDDPVSLTLAGAKGLGEAAVLLSLKDNGEENRLKRQVAQATKMQAVGQLAGGVAHDFNNILTAILGHCDLMLMRHAPGDSDYDDIQQIRHNSNRAAGLTRQLLAFSRQQTLRPQVLQLPDIISEVSNLLKRLLGESVTLVVKHGRNLGAVRADPGQLEQVIVNLAVNARDAMVETRRGGTLTLHTYAVTADEVRGIGSDILPVADYTALAVIDTGTGIPADILPKIFEPFFTTKEVGKGTGLGLSTVYGIVKQSGGFIFADSKPGQGTSFTIYLPVHRAEPAAAALAAPKPSRAADTWGTGTILLVEDEDMVRTVAERALVRQGYRVLTAANGDLALDLLEGLAADDKIDLLISDVMMPGMDGPTLVRTVRAGRPELPVLFMSGYAEEQLRRSIDLDRVAFLPKPFSVQQLGEAAKEALAGVGA